MLVVGQGSQTILWAPIVDHVATNALVLSATASSGSAGELHCAERFGGAERELEPDVQRGGAGERGGQPGRGRELAGGAERDQHVPGLWALHVDHKFGLWYGHTSHRRLWKRGGHGTDEFNHNVRHARNDAVRFRGVEPDGC